MAFGKRFFKTFRDTWLGRALAICLIWLISILLRVWRATLRVEVVDEHGLLRQKKAADGVIGGFWHNRLAFVPLFFPRRMRRRTAAITSSSRDGEYADILVRHFIGDTVRGSSSRGGRGAIVKMKHLLSAGWNVCVAVDGPRGPKYTLQPGVALLAKHCGAPVYPISINAPRRWQLRTWDDMQFPKPFSTVTLTIGQPVVIGPDCNVREAARERIQSALLAITDDRRSPD